METTLDDGVTHRDLVLAVRLLKDWRSKRYLRSLDVLVDDVSPRRLAHVVEEGLRSVAGGRGLWRFTGRDEDVITEAINTLNAWGSDPNRFSRTHRRDRERGTGQPDG